MSYSEQEKVRREKLKKIILKTTTTKATPRREREIATTRLVTLHQQQEGH